MGTYFPHALRVQAPSKSLETLIYYNFSHTHFAPHLLVFYLITHNMLFRNLNDTIIHVFVTHTQKRLLTKGYKPISYLDFLDKQNKTTNKHVKYGFYPEYKIYEFNKLIGK